MPTPQALLTSPACRAEAAGLAPKPPRQVGSLPRSLSPRDLCQGDPEDSQALPSGPRAEAGRETDEEHTVPLGLTRAAPGVRGCLRENEARTSPGHLPPGAAHPCPVAFWPHWMGRAQKGCERYSSSVSPNADWPRPAPEWRRPAQPPSYSESTCSVELRQLS